MENEAKELNQFYTKPEIAKRFVDTIRGVIDFNDYDNIIEPSAGSGNIFQFLPKDKRIGIDLQPYHPEVKKCDFFDFEFPKGKNLVIGNPPFGRQSTLAIPFFNKSALYADAIAFIIPVMWMKYRCHRMLDPDMNLYLNIVLPENSFTFGYEDYDVACVGQLWMKEPPTIEFKQQQSWNRDIKEYELHQIDHYQKINKCYEKLPSLF